MSKTPRTDKGRIWLEEWNGHVVDIDFARQLETELNKTKQILKHCIPFLPARAITHSGEEIELRELAEEASK